MANETTTVTKAVASGTQLTSIGIVKTVVGMVKAVDANGTERVLQTGDKVYANETIVTAADGAVIIEFQDGTHLDLARSTHIVLDSDIYTPKAGPSAAEAAEDEADRIAQAIAEGRDPSIVTEAAAAGGTTGDEGSSVPLVIGFDNTLGNVTSGFPTGTFSLAFPPPTPTLPPVEDTPAPEATPVVVVTVVVLPPEEEGETPIVVRGNVADVIEGTDVSQETIGTRDVTFTFQLTNADGTPFALVHAPVTITYHLENGTAIYGEDYTDGGTGSQTITIPSGSNTYSVTVQIFEDAGVENDETFSIVLDSAIGATIGTPSTFTVNIINDDSSTISITPGAEGREEGVFGDIVEEGNVLAYTISLNQASISTVTANLAFTGGTANNANDYTPTFYSDAALQNAITSVTFNPGDTSIVVYVGTSDNDPPFAEVNETVNVSITDIVGANAGTVQAVGTITDATLPVINIDPGMEDEGITGDIVEEGNVLAYTISLSGASDTTVTANLAFTGGTANNANDYTPTFYSDAALQNAITSVTFNPGDTSIVVYVGTSDNDPPFAEVNETVNVSITDIVGANAGTVQAVGTITDATLPVINIDPGMEDEGITGDIVEEGNVLAYTISLSGASDTTVTANLAFTGGTANNTNDYTPTFYSDAALQNAITSVTFNPGDTSIVVYVGTSDNDPPFAEVNETVNVSITDIVGANAGTVQAVGTITDATLPVINIDPGMEDEGITGDIVEEGNVLAYTISLSGASDTTVTANLAFTGGTANNANDYTPTFYSDAALQNAITSVTFNPGDTSIVVYVGTSDNDPPFAEVNETVNVSITDIVGANAGTVQAVGTITDATLPVINIDPGMEDEGITGDIVEEGNVLAYTISLSGASDTTVTANLAFTGGTANNTNDYTPTFYSDAALQNAITSVTFNPGDTSIVVYVGTSDNDPPFAEVNETVNVSITDIVGANAGTVQAVGTITDATLPVINIDPGMEDEGITGDIVEEGNVLAYTISLSGASDTTVTANLAFTGGTANNTNDYTPTFYSDAALQNAITSVTFNPGDTSIVVYVGTSDNDPPFAEVNETVNVSITDIVGANAGTVQAVGTITDATLPTISISGGNTVEEGGVLAYTVSLNGVSGTTVTANLGFGAGTATGGGNDYTSTFYADAAHTIPITSVTFTPGQTSTTVYVSTINNDPPFAEVNETVVATLSGIVGATAGTTSATDTITDATLPTISISGGNTVEEGGVLAYTVSLNGVSGTTVTANLGFGAGTATGGGNDYTSTFYADAAHTIPITSVTFTPGQTSTTVYVSTINNDPPFAEVNETVVATLSGIVGATAGTTSATDTITDATLPTISISGGNTVEEGGVLAYTVSLNGVSGTTVTANLGFGAGTATGGGNDYTSTFYADAAHTIPITSVTFTPGQTSTTVYVSTINNDPPFAEVNETVVATLSGIVGATAGTTSATDTITDATLPTISISGGNTVEEGGVLAYTVSLNGVSGTTVTANLGFGAGTATGGGNDYTSTFYADAAHTIPITSVTFTPGQTSTTVYVSTINNDPPFAEVNETVVATLSGIVGATAGTTSATDTITDATLPPATNTTASVNESAMDKAKTGSDLAASNVTGTNPSSATETVTGTLTVESGWTVNATSGTTAYGSYTIAANGTFVYTLINAPDVPPAGAASPTDAISYTITNGNGTQTNTLTVTIVDDAPLLDISNGHIQNSTNSVVNGVLAVMGADGVASGSEVNITNITAPAGLSSNGVTLVYSTIGSGDGSTVTATAGVGGPVVFTMQTHADGTYTFAQSAMLDLSVTTSDLQSSVGAGGPQSAYYIYKDGTFGSVENAADWSVKLTATKGGIVDNINPSQQGMGVQNNQFAGDETILMEFDDESGSSVDTGTPTGTFAYLAQITLTDLGVGEVVGYDVTYTNGTLSQTIHSDTNTNTVNGVLTIGVPVNLAGYYIDYIEFAPAAGSVVRMNGVSTFVTDDTKTADISFGFNAIDGDGDTVSGSVVITAQNSHTLTGTAGDDALGGGTGSDTLSGGALNDILTGGQGDDLLTGGLGADTFKWGLNDQTGSTALGDKITTGDFKVSEGDVLDLASLLVGEHSTAGGTYNLDSYLNFAQVGADTVLTIDVDGTGGGTATQKITFVGTDLFAQTGTAPGDSAALVQNLLNTDHLKTDA